MPLRLVSFARLAVVKLPRWWSVSCSPAAPARASGAFQLGVQDVTLMMSSNWNVKDVTTKYWSNLAKFRDSIRERKQRADLGWSWAVQMVIGISIMSSIWKLECRGYECKIFKQSCQVQKFNQRDKQRADLGWSWAVQMVIGTSRSDWNVEDVTANNWSTPAKFKY